jgi:phosphinothricin acetyltransferase
VDADKGAPQAIVRECFAEDIPATTAIYGHAVRYGFASFEIDPPDAAEMTRRFEAVALAGYPYLVAEIGGAVVGYAYAGPYRARPAYRSTVENSVYVRDDFQGRGVGRRLLMALVEATGARGFRQMVAIIGDSGNAASIRLHESVGFEHVGVLRSVGWKSGRWLDTVLMQRPLGPGDSLPR